MNDEALPPLVRAAMAGAERAGFARSCAPETGRLLRALAATVSDGVIAELGSGYGVGAAWLAAGLRPGVAFVTVESEEAAARATAELLADVPGALAMRGDWRAALRHAPFALIFPDVAEAKGDGAPDVIAALRPGGIVVLDDLTPEEHWPPAWRGRPDPLRERWLAEPRLVATELRLTATTAAIVAVRR